jgi:hypothetical protein
MSKKTKQSGSKSKRKPLISDFWTPEQQEAFKSLIDSLFESVFPDKSPQEPEPRRSCKVVEFPKRPKRR